MPDTPPPGALVDLFELGEVDATVTEEKREELREFVERAEAGEFEADPGLEACVRLARAILDDCDDAAP